MNLHDIHVVYLMSSFKLPTNVCTQIDKIICDFWWGKDSEKGRYYASLSWEKICQPKENGGLGFRKTQDFNMVICQN